MSQGRPLLSPLNLPFVENLTSFEDVWAILKAKVNVRRPRGTKGYLKVIREEWRGIFKTTIKVPDRLLKVVKRRKEPG